MTRSKIIQFTLSFAFSLLISGCGFLPVGSPLRNEVRVVSFSKGSSAHLRFKTPIVITDYGYQTIGVGSGIGLPQGVYSMEGEDSAYRFFRAPSKIEVRVRRSAGTDQGFFEGGIALSKRTFGEAAVYDTHAPPNSRRIVRMLGAEFLLEEDTRWTRHIPKD